MSVNSSVVNENLYKKAQNYYSNHQFHQAWVLCERLLKKNPTHIPSLTLIVLLIEGEKDVDRALDFYKKALNESPKDASLWFLMGTLHSKLSLCEQSRVYFEKSLECDPLMSKSLEGIAMSYLSEKKYEEAIPYLLSFLKIDPNSEVSQRRLLECYFRLENYSATILLAEKMLEIHPDQQPNFFASLGDCYYKTNSFKKSEMYCLEAVRLDPSFRDAYIILANIYSKFGYLEKSVAYAKKTLDLEITAGQLEFYAFHLNYFDSFSKEFVFNELSWLGNKIDSLSTDKRKKVVFSKKNSKKLRVGYVSGDFKQHSVSYFMLGLLSGHHKGDFNLFCYSTLKKKDNVTEQLEKLIPHWRDVSSVPNSDFEETVRQDQIDILVDLSGYTSSNRLASFCKRLAPVQVTYLGYPNTTGLKEIDYRLTDWFTDPEGADQFYSEKLYRLPVSFLCYSPSRLAPKVQLPPCLKKGYITFGSFNTIKKVSPSTMKAWKDILLQVPNSRLICKDVAFFSDESKIHFFQFFKDHGIEQERIILNPIVTSHTGHLMSYHEIDIALDSFPYNGTTTTCEALWMGVPVVALKGDTHRSRVSAMLLNQIGCSDWITSCVEDYIQKAVALAQDPNVLRELRIPLRGKMANSPLCDSKRFVNDVEEAYRWMWNQYLGK